MKQRFTKLLAAVALLVSLALPLAGWGQKTTTTVFLETFGSTSSNTAYSSYQGFTATSNMFTDNEAINTHYSGSGSVGKNNLSQANLSNGYEGASGLSGCYHGGTANTQATIIQISNINIAGYENLQVSFGALGGSTSHKVNVQYKIDNGEFVNLITNGAITNANWTLLSQDITETGTSLTLKFTHTPTKAWTIRMDDIKVTGTSSGAGNFTVTYTPGTGTGTNVVDSDIESGTSITVRANNGENGNPDFSKEGHTFSCWNDGTDDVNPGASYPVNSNVIFTAQWTINKHNVTLPATDTYGTYTMDATNPVAYGSTVNLTYTPATGYDNYIATWSVNGTVVNGNSFTMPDENVTVTVSVAQYEQPTEVEVTLNNTFFGCTAFTSWNSNLATTYSGTQSEVTITLDKGEGQYMYINTTGIRMYAGNTLTFEAPNGYNITEIALEGATGFSTNLSADGLEDGTWTGTATQVVITGNTSGKNMTGATITLAKIYEITYADNLTNGDFGTGNPTTALAGDNITVTTVPANGYHLSSMTYSNGSNTVEATINGTSGSFAMPANDITVFAVFEEDVACTITYSFNGAIVDDFTETVLEATLWDVQYVGTFVEEYANLSELGFTFVGWTVDPTNPVVLNSYTPIADVTLYAVFTKSTSGTVSQVVILDGGEGDEVLTSSYQTKDITENGFTYHVISAKYQPLGTGYENNISSFKTIILDASNDGSLYNITAFGDGITKFELYENKGASTSVVVGINFSSELISEYDEATASTYALSTADHVYEFEVPQGAKYFYLKPTTNKNPQIQLRITYSTSGSATDNYTRIYTKEITGYGTDHAVKNGWYLIASPVANDFTPSADNGFITDFYDLYRFNQAAELEWENQEEHQNDFDIESGRGYLYASSTNTTLVFAGSPYSGDGVVPLVYNANVDYKGINLVGNPFSTSTTIDLPYYKMNDGRTALTSELEGGTIAAMEGVFVYAYDETSHQAISSVTFTASRSRGNSNASVNINVMHNGADIDNAIVRFDEGKQLPKFQLFKNNAKLYIPQNGKDYAIVNSEAQGEMPVNFKAQENGTYTLNIDTENGEMNYLHLIDNMTGMDVDLLQTPSYTFDATTNDYASRFRLVFSANDVNGPSTGSGTFAFYSNGNWVIGNEGEATLQVIDINGRIVSNETINGSVATSIVATPGVYMLRLVNGNEVKTQKIVVR